MIKCRKALVLLLCALLICSSFAACGKKSGGTDDYVVNFAQLTQRAGNFLVAREPIRNFDWKMLEGKNVLGGRAGKRQRTT